MKKRHHHIGRQLLCMALSVLLICAGSEIKLALPNASAQGQSAQTDKIKEGVRRFGTGENARVKIEMQNKGKLSGYIREAGADDFVVFDQKTGKDVKVAYSEVRQIKGRHLSTGAKIAIGIGIAVGVLAVLALIGLHYAD